MNQVPQPKETGNGLLLSLLCLALHRKGGEIVLDNLDELKECLFVPSVQPVRDGVVKLTVAKYTKQPKAKKGKSHANSK